MVGRIIRNGKGTFEFVELDGDTVGQVIEEVVQRNLDIFRATLLKTREYLLLRGLPEQQNFETQIALQIFDKTAIRLYPILNDELKRRIHELKNGNGNGEG